MHHATFVHHVVEYLRGVHFHLLHFRDQLKNIYICTYAYFKNTCHVLHFFYENVKTSPEVYSNGTCSA